MTINAIAAVSSQTAIAIPTTKPSPDMPIICSEMFAAIRDAPIAHQGSGNDQQGNNLQHFFQPQAFLKNKAPKK